MAVDDPPARQADATYLSSKGDDSAHLGSSLEAGTPPEDRRFRPDIQGLRAVAVLLVALNHAHVSFFSEGSIGVDVFFVISGYVITGIILREVAESRHVEVVSFYARRIRRILPAALLVIVITVLAERVLVGSVAAANGALYGRKAAFFLYDLPNVWKLMPHGAYTSPFGAYWSLSVEEQFYLVYPLIVVGLLLIPYSSIRTKLGLAMLAITAASLWYSVVHSPGLGGLFFTYTSPLARAWELSVGCLLAICGRWVQKIPVSAAAIASWAGLAAILGAAHFLNAAEGGYPGYIAAWPVLGAAFVIAGGTVAQSRGAEWALKQRPCQALGRWSYSIYLWHYPILILAAQRFGPLTVPENLLLLCLAIAISAATFALVENPIRRSTFLTRSAWISVALGVVVLGAVAALLTGFV